MIICESYGAFLVRFCELISSDCIVWVEVEILDPVDGVCVTVGPFSWLRSALPTPPYPLSPISLSPLYALIIPRPIYSHLLWLTVGMNRATNSTGSLNEGRSNLKVRTMSLLLEGWWFKISDQGNRTQHYLSLPSCLKVTMFRNLLTYLTYMVSVEIITRKIMLHKYYYEKFISCSTCLMTFVLLCNMVRCIAT